MEKKVLLILKTYYSMTLGALSKVTALYEVIINYMIL